VVWIIILILLAGAWTWSYLWLNEEVVSEIEVWNPEGYMGTALVVYHPGRGSFHSRVISGFVEGLVSRGWQVEVATVSAQAPTDLSEYGLLVLGSPTYWFTPSWPIRRYLSRLGDLGGQRTVTIITGMGAGERSTSLIEKQVRGANGDLVDSMLFYWMRPNDDDNYVNTDQNKALAVEMATQAAKDIPLPAK
jgi:flavorubredoxin